MHLFISTWTLGCLFYTLGYNLPLPYLCCHSDCFSFDCWELFQLAIFPWTYFTSLLSFLACLFVCLFLRTFLLSGTTKMLHAHLILPQPSPTISHFARQPWFLSLNNGTEADIWIQDVFTATGASWLLSPLSQ